MVNKKNNRSSFFCVFKYLIFILQHFLIYAILSLKKSERSLGNSMQSGGSFIGSFFGTGVLLVAYHYYGWSNVLVLLSVFVLVALAPLFISKREIPSENIQKERVSLKDILSFFKQKGKVKHILLLIFYYSGIIGIMAMLKPYLVDLGYDVNKLLLCRAFSGTLTAAVSTLVAGFLMRKAGRRTALFVFFQLALLPDCIFTICREFNPRKRLFTLVSDLFGVLTEVLLVRLCNLNL